MAPVPGFRTGYFTDFLFFSLSLAAKLGPLRQCLLCRRRRRTMGAASAAAEADDEMARRGASRPSAAGTRVTSVGQSATWVAQQKNLKRIFQVHHFHARAPSALQEAPAILRQRQCRRVNESGTISAVGWCVPSCVVAASARAWCYVRALCCVVCGRCVRVCACVCARARAIDEPSACN